MNKQNYKHPQNMDPNLVTIRDSNIHLIKQGKLAKATVQAKSYLLYMLTSDKMHQIDRELDVFVDHLYELAGDNAPQRTYIRKPYRK